MSQDGQTHVKHLAAPKGQYFLAKFCCLSAVSLLNYVWPFSEQQAKKEWISQKHVENVEHNQSQNPHEIFNMAVKTLFEAWCKIKTR